MPSTTIFQSGMLDHMCWACKEDALKLISWVHYLLSGYQRVAESEEEGWFLPRALTMCAVWSSPQPTARERRRTSFSAQVKQQGFNMTIQEKNRNPVAFEGKGIVIGSVLKILRARDGGWSHLPAGTAEGDRSSRGISYNFIHVYWQELVFLVVQTWDS